MLNDKLRKLERYPYHMPGHKRNKKFDIVGSEIDITEITGFDDLHNPKQDIAALQNEIANVWGYEKSLISVNGSTCCILAAIFAVCKSGDKILIARNCHKSVYNACFLNKLKVEYIEPEFDSEFGVYKNITQKSVDCAVKNNPDAKALVITSPTYEGFVSNIQCDLPIIVDSAHGSHFGFTKWLPKKAQGDIVIQSFHKTLPSLTQTAVIHINNSLYEKAVKKYMDMFETSSPSYILMASIEKCCEYMKNSLNDFEKYKNILDKFYKEAKSINGLKILKNDDITRIVISFDGYSGTELGEILINHGIEPEGTTLNYVILISTIADTEKGFNKLINALKCIEPKNEKKCKFIKMPVLPKKECEAYEITETKAVALNDSVGKCCAETVYAYPPATPIITAGEIISSDTLDYINQCLKCSVNIIDTENLLPDSILTKA